MDKLTKQIPTSYIGPISIVIVVVAAIMYLVSKIRANDMKILRDTNNDQGARISLLESAVVRLEKQVTDLQHQNKTLNDLVVVALKQYFFENPTVAKDMKDNVLG